MHTFLSSEATKHLQFSNLIFAICTLFCDISQSEERIAISPVSNNLNRIVMMSTCRDSLIGLLEWNIYTPQSVLGHYIFASFLACLFPAFFNNHLFCVFVIFFYCSKGVFYTYNVSFPLALLSLSFPFLSSVSSPFFCLSLLSFLPFLFLSSHCLPVFGAATTTMLHRLQRAWHDYLIIYSVVQ